jgi:hypothetical protein
VEDLRITGVGFSYLAIDGKQDREVLAPGKEFVVESREWFLRKTIELVFVDGEKINGRLMEMIARNHV